MRSVLAVTSGHDAGPDLVRLAVHQRQHGVLSVLPWRPGLLRCLFLGLPPIYVSSATTVPLSSDASGSRRMASRMRCRTNQAVLAVRPYLRSISRAETPFLEAHISKTTRTQVRTGTFVPWKMVPVRTLNCLRQAAQSSHEPVVVRPSARRGWARQDVDITARVTLLGQDATIC